MQDHEKHELFDRYLREELNEKELDNFLGQLENDSEFATEFETHRHLVEGIRLQRESELKAFIRANARVRSLPNAWSRKTTWLAAAVLLLFGISYFVFVPSLKEDQLAEKAKVPIEQPRPGNEKNEAIEAEPEESAQQVAPEKKEFIPPVVIEEDVEEADLVWDAEISNYAPMEVADDPIVVQEDRMLEDSVFMIQLAFVSKTESLEEKQTETPEARPSRGVVKEKTEEDKPLQVKLRVQFWQSPIGYKGYRFDGRQLVLFGMERDSVEIKYLVLDAELEVYRIYLKSGDTYYSLIDDARYHPYAVETDRKIIEQLR